MQAVHPDRTPRPQIVAMEPPKPLPKRPSQPNPAQRPSAPLAIAPDESGELVAAAKERSGWRIVLVFLLLLVAAGAGVVTTAYLLDVELPLIGRW